MDKNETMKKDFKPKSKNRLTLVQEVESLLEEDKSLEIDIAIMKMIKNKKQSFIDNQENESEESEKSEDY